MILKQFHLHSDIMGASKCTCFLLLQIWKTDMFQVKPILALDKDSLNEYKMHVLNDLKS